MLRSSRRIRGVSNEDDGGLGNRVRLGGISFACPGNARTLGSIDFAVGPGHVATLINLDNTNGDAVVGWLSRARHSCSWVGVVDVGNLTAEDDVTLHEDGPDGL